MQAAHTGRLASLVELRPTNCAACNGPLPVQARIVRNWSLLSRVRIHLFLTAQRAGNRNCDRRIQISLFRILHLQKNERHPMR